MAERRMFAKTIIDSDAFLDMPLSAQALYFHLSMRADDDGFINNPKKLQRMVGCADDDMRLLVAKAFIIPFESGVVVIKHWRINNYIRNDRYKPTNYTEEMAQLQVKENGAYTEKLPLGIPNGYQMDTQYRLGKDRLDKNSIEEKDINVEKESPTDKPSSPAPKHKYGQYKNVLLTEKEYNTLIGMTDGKEAIEFISEYREYKGYKAKSDYLAIRKWVFNALKEQRIKNGNQTDAVPKEETEEEKIQRQLRELRKARPDLANYSDKDLLRYF
nr:MAG TPA: replisome organizer [Caudoviricetes sp.]